MSQYQPEDEDKVRVELTRDELRANIHFLQDHIFRVKHIDPKIPENRSNLEQVRAAESALAALQLAAKAPSGKATTTATPLELPKRIDQPDFHRPIKAVRGRQG